MRARRKVAGARNLALLRRTARAGDPEPVWADEGGAYLLHAYSRASEARQLVPAPLDSDAEDAGPEQQQQQEQLDMLVRSTVRSSSISSLVGGVTAAAAAAAGGSVSGAAGAGSDAPAPSPAAADDESEGIAYNQGGSVVFTGGSYSVGPEYAGASQVRQGPAAAFVVAGGCGCMHAHAACFSVVLPALLPMPSC